MICCEEYDGSLWWVARNYGEVRRIRMLTGSEEAEARSGDPHATVIYDPTRHAVRFVKSNLR